MPRIMLAGPSTPFLTWLGDQLKILLEESSLTLMPMGEGLTAATSAERTRQFIMDEGIDCLIVRPIVDRDACPRPGIERIAAVADAARRAALQQIILVSSTAVYSPSHHNPGFVDEEHLPLPTLPLNPEEELRPLSGTPLPGSSDHTSRKLRPLSGACAFRPKNAVAAAWASVEEAFCGSFDGRATAVLVLRSAEILGRSSDSEIASMVMRSALISPAGFDPSIQFLHPEDFTTALTGAVRHSMRGLYNIVPNGTVPLKKALFATRVRRIPMARCAMRTAQRVFRPLRISRHPDYNDYLVHSFTASGRRMAEENGFAARHSSSEAVAALSATERSGFLRGPIDEYGMDAEYIRKKSAGFLRFLHRSYWRVEEHGLENVPREGRAVLVGVHRGFMPFDGVMMLYGLHRSVGRIPRFLIHPCLIKFPGIANFMTKLGGIPACRQNADWVLQREGLLGIYPEGIRGAFTLYRDAYRLGRFGRSEFIRIALRNRAPLIPVVTVGSAEIYPIWGRIRWRRFEQFTEWPFLPLTVPFPLPSKWHTLYLPAMHIEREYGPAAAGDTAIVRSIRQRVCMMLQKAMDEIRGRRPSAFFGRVFDRKGNVELETADRADLR